LAFGMLPKIPMMKISISIEAPFKPSGGKVWGWIWPNGPKFWEKSLNGQ